MLCLFLLHTALYPHVVGCIMLYNTISLIISLLWLVHTHIGSSGKGVTRYNPNSCWSIMLVPIKGTCIGSILHFQTNPHVTSTWLDIIHAHHIMSPFVPLICPNPVFCAPADLPKLNLPSTRRRPVGALLCEEWPVPGTCLVILPSGELTFCHGKSPFLMGKSTISMAIFNCYVSSPEGTPVHPSHSTILVLKLMVTTGDPLFWEAPDMCGFELCT